MLSLFWLLLHLFSSAQGMNPLETTVGLLTDLQGQVVSDGEREQRAYETYAHWCKETAAEKAEEVKRITKQKAKLEADIQLASSDIEASTTKIEELGKELSANEQKKTVRIEERAAELQTFQSAEKEMVETIEMLGRAIEVLEKEMQGTQASLVQVTIDTNNLENILLGLGALIDAAGIPPKDTQRLATLLQARQDAADGDGLVAPNPESYDPHSKGIVEVMEDMRDKAEEQLRELREGERNSHGNSELIRQSLVEQGKNLEKDMKDEKSEKAASEEAQATAEGDLSGTVAELETTQQALKDTRDSCLRTASDHETSVAARKEELGVLAKAKKVIQESMLQLQAQQAPVAPGDLQQQGDTSFVQVSSKAMAQVQKHSHVSLLSRQVLNQVKRLAAEQKSQALAQLASRLSSVVRFGISSGSDPFAKVKELIGEMTKRLEAEMSAEAKEKTYCDDEMRKTEEQQHELKDKIDGLSGNSERSQSKSASLKSEVTKLQQEVTTLAMQQADLDASRIECREAFSQSKVDLQKSLEGTRSAIRILRDYYANNDDDAGSAALLQSDDSFAAEMKAPKPPQKYAKSGGAGSSIIGILEVSESDLAKNLAVEETEEAGKQAEYDKLTQQNKKMKFQKEKDMAHRTGEYKALDKSITDVAADYDTESEELAAVEEYFAKVKERCIAKPDSYQTRKENREAEISGLRDALMILMSDGQKGSLLQRGHLRGQPTTSEQAQL